MNILITAGPTREPIDPVRYISNHSTGKMGIAIAEEFANNGHNVTLILGPTNLKPQGNIAVINVNSAEDMYQACLSKYGTSDITIFSAAVADYTPKVVATQKVKKSQDEWSIELVKTKDIAYEMGKMKTNKQINVVFALETNNEIEHALSKLEKKNANFVVLNSMNDIGAGFGFDTNKVTFLFNDKSKKEFELKSKVLLAKDIFKEVVEINNLMDSIQ